MGAACPLRICNDAGVITDADTCTAVPQSDSTCGGTTPHFYSCFLASLPPPCMIRTIGDATDGYCCP
jgi:hypothetical protein